MCAPLFKIIKYNKINILYCHDLIICLFFNFIRKFQVRLQLSFFKIDLIMLFK